MASGTTFKKLPGRVRRHVVGSVGLGSPRLGRPVGETKRTPTAPYEREPVVGSPPPGAPLRASSTLY